jgi:hypothetical protein
VKTQASTNFLQSFLEQLQVIHLVEKFLSHMQPEDSPLQKQKPTVSIILNKLIHSATPILNNLY